MGVSPSVKSVSTGIDRIAAVIRTRGVFSLSRPGDGQWTADGEQSVASSFSKIWNGERGYE